MHQLGFDLAQPPARPVYADSIHPRARASDPSTSYEAAARVHEIAPGQYAAILQALALGPAGAHEIARRAQVAGNPIDSVMVCRRLPELLAQGRVALTGRKVTTAAGRREREWGLPA